MHPAVEASHPRAAPGSAVGDEGHATSAAPRQAALWMLASAACFTAMTLAVRRLTEQLPFHEVASARALGAALITAAIARARRAPLTARDRGGQWRRTAFGTLALASGFFALSRLPVGDAVTLGSTTPLWVAALSPWLLGERPGPRVWAGVVVGLVGVALIAGAHFDVGSARLPALAVALFGALCSALAMVSLRRLRGEAPEAVAFHFSLVAGVALFLVGLGRHRWPEGAAWALLAVAGFGGGLGQVAMTRAYSLDSAARVSALGYSGVAMNLGAAAWVLGEVPDGWQLTGAALVVAAGLLVLERRPA